MLKMSRVYTLAKNLSKILVDLNVYVLIPFSICVMMNLVLNY